MTAARVALLLTCLVGGCRTPEPECLSTVDCGTMQACLDGECRDVACLSGADCAIEQRCDPETYECLPGCASSDDCLVGDRCDVTTGTCVARTCTETQADCALGERCDASTGVCARDPAPYCDLCGRDEDCGPTGLCAQLTPRGPGYCLLTCSPEAFDPCPAGLQCSAAKTSDGVTEFRCVGLCDRL